MRRASIVALSSTHETMSVRFKPLICKYALINMQERENFKKQGDKKKGGISSLWWWWYWKLLDSGS